MTTDEQYASEFDLWVRLVLIVLPVISIAVVVITAVSGEGLAIAVIGLLIVAGIYGGLLFPVYYRLESTRLVVRFGLIRQRIPYDAITSVRPTRSPLSSPALSLRRLRIAYARSAVMISPVRRDEFLASLASRAGLLRDGEALRRPGE
jgi:hypothetical protein